MNLHIDIETYSSIDIKKAGAYAYAESLDFEILMIAYAIDNGPVKIIDLAQGEGIPNEFYTHFRHPDCTLWAHNAAFERVCFNAVGWTTEIERWKCTAILSGYCGYPLSLDGASSAMDLREKKKKISGLQLIKYFSMPVRPTKVNGGRVRNLPHHDLEKWEEFKKYCVQDVRVERAIKEHLSYEPMPELEWQTYWLDQQINDTGVAIDVAFVKAAMAVDDIQSKRLRTRMVELTGLDNPNSPAQLGKWLSSETGKNITSLAKDALPEIAEGGSEVVKEVVDLRLRSSKTSIKKYAAMLNCLGENGRARGLFQFYGASRTGRWAGRLIQLQNLRRNDLDNLDEVRRDVKYSSPIYTIEKYDRVSDTLSQLIRTAIVAKGAHTFAVADFSAIEARVIAWLAGEQWRLDVFNSHGKIYEASAAMMFNVPIESVTKGSELRSKGKVAELALGYQGAVGAMKQMGAEDMGLNEDEISQIVSKWRKANPAIVDYWRLLSKASKLCIAKQREIVLKDGKGIAFNYENGAMTIKLPSGRKLYYQGARLSQNNYGNECVKYRGVSTNTRQWGWLDTYGGKLAENIVQATARDLLSEAMLRVDKYYPIVLHVHDEIAVEISKDTEMPLSYESMPDIRSDASEHLEHLCDLMSIEPDWAEGLPLNADGYLTDYYKKD